MPEATRTAGTASRAINASARKYGRAIACAWLVAARKARLYAGDHANTLESVSELSILLRDFLEIEGECRFSLFDDELFLNEVRIRPDLSTSTSLRALARILRDRDIGEVVFEKSVGVPDLRRLADILAPPHSAGWQGFSALLARAGIEHVRISRYRERSDLRGKADEDERALTLGAYFQVIRSVGEAFESARSSRRLETRTLRRVVQSLADAIVRDARLLLSIAHAGPREQDPGKHGANVAVLSMALAARLGLPRRVLGDIGLAAAIHDLGLALEPAAGDGENSPRIEDHVEAGARLLLEERRIERAANTLLVAFLHHHRYDGTGVPRLHRAMEQNLFTRIVAVADAYDEATQGVGGPSTAPDAALRAILDGAGTEFDPLVAKAFINLLGLYPPGCLVRLDSGEVGVVLAPPADPRYLDRPTVRIVANARGEPAEGTRDLLERGETGRFQAKILKIYRNEEIDLQIEEYLAVI